VINLNQIPNSKFQIPNYGFLLAFWMEFRAWDLEFLMFAIYCNLN